MRLYATLLRARTVADLLPDATSMQVTDASLLPPLSPGEYFVIQIIEGPTIETVHATARVGNVFTIQRAQEGSSKKQFSPNALCLITIDPYGYELEAGGGGGGAVDSVNGQTGIVELDSDDIDEGATNLYFTTSERSKLLSIAPGAQVNTVNSVNGKTGTVVLNPDDLNDSTTTHKFTTSADISKLAGIENNADVTDTSNVLAALAGTITTTTLADNDKVILQDTSASNVPRTVTAQAIADLAKTLTAFYAYNSSAQSVATGTSTKCNLNSTVYDRSGWFNTSTFRYIPQVAGYYIFVGSVMFQSVTDGMYCIPQLQRNGIVILEQDIKTGGTGLGSSNALGMCYMNGSTDYVEFFIYQASGTNKSTLQGSPYTFFQGCILEKA